MVIDTLAEGETPESVAAAYGITVDEVRAANRQLAGLSPAVAERNRLLKAYLHENLYRDPRIERMKDKARRILAALFARYRENPRLLSLDVLRRIPGEGLERTIADHIAGMTDRYAAEDYLRLFDPTNQGLAVRARATISSSTRVEVP